ncbi:TPA: VapE domain-containing protein [Streptococcus agalactiae]
MKDYQNKLSQATQPAFAPAFRTRKGRGDKEYVISSPYNVGKVFEFYENIFTGIKYNEFEKTIEITKTLPWSKEKGLWTNEQTSLCIAFIDDKYRFTPRKEHIEVAITALAKKNSYHPIKQRIESQKWDGKARGERYFIDLLGCADNSYNREIAKVWLTGLIARIYLRKVKFEVVPILIDKRQGTGKSTVTKRLLPSYHTDSEIKFGKNDSDYQKIQANAIISLGELKGMSKAEIETVKSFISSDSDTYREPYERKATPHPRHCVFIGTANKKSFLKDSGTERRFFPIECGINDVEKHPMEVEEDYFLQILAEAKVWFNNYEPLTPSKELMNQLADIQEDYKVEDVDKEIIDQLLNEFQIVEGWDSLSQYEQRQYVLKQLGEPLDNAQSYSDYPSAQTNCLLQVTSPNHIAYLGFNQKPTQGGKALISQKIRDHLDNDDGWKKGENPARKRLFKGGTPVSYYERV